MGVPRSLSYVPAKLAHTLISLSSRVPVAIITSKDYAFVRPRTAFAEAWACAGGLEIVLAGGPRCLPREVPDIEPPFKRIGRKLRGAVLLERKLSSDGRLLGFTVDWRLGPPLSNEIVESLTGELRTSGLHVVHDRTQPFLDAYAIRPNKGRALRRLGVHLGVKTGVMYLGDSSFDNTAFDSADISVGVDHGQSFASLRCEYIVDGSRLASILDSLLKADLEFTPSVFRLP